MKNILLVPTHLDALYLATDQLMTEAIADFSRLPFFNGSRDIYADVANVSEHILSPSLQNQNLRLKAGLHLHWSLPDALTAAKDGENGLEFPAVPNRWLVIRTENKVTEKWVVESDYFFPEETDLTEEEKILRKDSITYPKLTDGTIGNRQPYRYMGRVVSEDDYDSNNLEGHEYLERLTAVGYGESSFAALYPNCKSVFGFHDPNIPNAPVTYDIVGWFDEMDNDFLRNELDWNSSERVVLFKADFINALSNDFINEVLTDFDGEDAWEEATNSIWEEVIDYKWLDANDNDPEQAFIIAPYDRTLSGKNDAWEEEIGRVLDLFLKKALKEKANWAFKTIISKTYFIEKLTAKDAAANGDSDWQWLIESGWLLSLEEEETNPAQAIILLKEERPADSDDSSLTSPIETIEATLDALVMERFPEQVVCYSRLLFEPEKKDYEGIISKTDFLNELAAIDPSADGDLDWQWLIEAGWLLSEEEGETNPNQAIILSEDGRPLDSDETGLSCSIEIIEATLDALALSVSSITFGNSGKEALSAYLANQLESDTDKQEVVENQLEALFITERLEGRKLDVNSKFLEARHENGFNAQSGGNRWLVTTYRDTSIPADAQAAKTNQQLELTTELSDALNLLNELQQEYDQAQFKIESKRTQLFADWYKYMLTTYPPEDTRDDYPDIDEVKYFIENEVIPPLEAQIWETGVLDVTHDSDNGKSYFTELAIDGNTNALAANLAKAINDLQDKLVQHNADHPDQGFEYVMKQQSGPRYWQPKEPVALLTGDLVKATNRHGQDGRSNSGGYLECQVVRLEDDGAAPFYISKSNKLSVLSTTIDGIENAAVSNQIGFQTWEQKPWNPFMLEWEVEVYPLLNKGNVDTGDSGEESPVYRESFILDNYEIPVQGVDLNVSDSTLTQGRLPNIYNGRSFLTSQACKGMTGRLEEYLDYYLLPEYYSRPGNEVPLADQHDDYLKENYDAILYWYENETDYELNESNPVYTTLRAYGIAKDTCVLSQSLGGFNRALLMLKQSLQLPVGDPIGFQDYAEFTERIAGLMAKNAWLAPQPLNDFNPIRTGKMNLNQLRVVDTFGQFRQLDLFDEAGDLTMEIFGSAYNKIAVDSNQNEVSVQLPPRLPQPARIHFRWLSAETSVEQMTNEPSSSPICGWVMSNHLDRSLMIYDANGKALGSVEAEEEDGKARWRPAPGLDSQENSDEITNEHLNEMVAHLRNQGVTYVEDFIVGIDRVMTSIEPEEFEHQQALSLLIGRPMALVRASIDLQLKGDASIHQGWEAFKDDRTDGIEQRQNDNFTKVQFPIRIGAYNQFNDGLIGYWKELREEPESDTNFDYGYEFSRFYLNYDQISDPNIDNPLDFENDDIQFLSDDDVPILQTIDDSPELVSMLIDPRAKIHAFSGILPAKEISVPPALYLHALQSIEVTFLTAPLLMTTSGVQAPLPTMENYEWYWLETDGTDWGEQGLEKAEKSAVFYEENQKIKEGWLKLKKKE